MSTTILQNALNSDALLSCALILCLTVLGIKLFPFDAISMEKILGVLRNSSSHDKYHQAISAFNRYEKLSLIEMDRMRSKYASIGRTYKRIGYDLGYPKKLTRLAEVTQKNARITSMIAKYAVDDRDTPLVQCAPSPDELSKDREVLRHLVRDWGEEGKAERSVTFAPILEKLESVDCIHRSSQKVLLPGSGLGRLAWEISKLGFDTTANEISPYMNATFKFLCSFDKIGGNTPLAIYPYAHWFSHQKSNNATFRAVEFPDTVPRLAETFRLLDSDFLKIDSSEKYDYIVTQFFIDTSLNIISTLEQIHRLLKPGGEWINLGPLLWTGGAQAALELSLEEILSLTDILGFEVDPRSRKTIDCEYTADKEAMMKWIYRAEFWIAKKRTE